MKVLGYLRVSTDKQSEEGLGLELQEEAIKKWARENRHRLTSFHKDEGQSGSNDIDTRLGLAAALEALGNGEAGGLIVYRLDRLARDLVLQEQLLKTIRAMGADLFSTSAAEASYLTDDPDDPSRKLIRQILGAVSEYERAMISLRLRAGKARKKANGGYAGGRPPFGYRVENGALVADEEEARIIERMAELRSLGLGLRETARALNAEGLRPKGGTLWHGKTVGRVVRRSPSAS